MLTLIVPSAWLAIVLLTHGGQMMLAGAIGYLAIAVANAFAKKTNTKQSGSLFLASMATHLSLIYLGGWHFVDRLVAEFTACPATNWQWDFLLQAGGWLGMICTYAGAAFSIIAAVAYIGAIALGGRRPSE